MNQQHMLSRRAFLHSVGLMSGAVLLASCVAPTASTGGTAEQAAAGKTKVRFYGQIDEFASTPEMVAALQEHFKDQYEIEMIKVDFGNLDTIIKTAILSGDPADIYFYWPGALRSYVDAGQALDLTPYLEADDGAWAKTFIPGNLVQGKYDDKYFAVPDDQTGAAVFVNDTLAQQLGVTIPDEMSWEQFMAICAEIKAKDSSVFPFAIQQQWQSWLPRMGVFSLGKEAGQLEALANGEVPMTDPIFKTALENAGALYTEGYVYPGEGALTSTMDEITAAFAQQKVVMVAAVFTTVQSLHQLATDNNFTIRAILWPQMGKEKVVLGGCNGFFVPYNTKNPEAAVEVLKVWLGKELQAINVKHGIITSNAELEITDPNAAALAKFGDYFPTTAEFTSLSTELGNYADKNLLPDYVLGESADDVLNKMEELRQQALASK